MPKPIFAEVHFGGLKTWPNLPTHGVCSPVVRPVARNLEFNSMFAACVFDSKKKRKVDDEGALSPPRGEDWKERSPTFCKVETCRRFGFGLKKKLGGGFFRRCTKNSGSRSSSGTKGT